MKRIYLTDIIFARVTSLGREILNIRISGVESVDMLMQRLRKELGNCIGLVRLYIRNMSQGWTHTGSYCLTL